MPGADVNLKCCVGARPAAPPFAGSTESFGRAQKGPCRRHGTDPYNDYPGDVLLSQGAAPQVPSALVVLTSVFGMGTGVAPPLWSPGTLLYFC